MGLSNLGVGRGRKLEDNSNIYPVFAYTLDTVLSALYTLSNLITIAKNSKKFLERR